MYDSLARLFLFIVLEWLRFPAQYIAALAFLHKDTTIRFLVNGLRSRKVEVTSGIRQGCPLAPIVFILALEPLYRLIDAEVGITGVKLCTASRTVMAGYADDTAVYLGSVQELPVFLYLSNRFGVASGLRVNAKKTIVIALCRDGAASTAALPGAYALLTPNTYCRYLGTQVGGADFVRVTWEKAMLQLSVRLRLAADKSLTQDQRATIVTAVVIPKLTHIARHAWPTMPWIDDAQMRVQNFVW